MFRIHGMTPQQLLDDVVTADTIPLPVVGRHVSTEATSLSILSFVGGRFPRHRADDVDREFSEFADLAR
jgi:hypothetical protein